MTKQFKFWCKGTSSNLNFNKKGWWTFPDFILSKYFDGLSIFESEDFVACQWTGLTDCNGRKIFEGDFVRWDDASKGKYWRFAKVVWNEKGGWAFRKIPSKCIGENCQYEHDFNLTNFIYSPDTSKYGNVLEVVGNIFENPELLN